MSTCPVLAPSPSRLARFGHGDVYIPVYSPVLDALLKKVFFFFLRALFRLQVQQEFLYQEEPLVGFRVQGLLEGSGFRVLGGFRV